MKRIWITGAGSGIGEAVVRRLASRGHTIIASGRRAGPLEDLARNLPRVLACPMDVTDRQAVGREVARMGRVDTAILCAGTHAPTPGASFNSETVRVLVVTNLMGAVHCIEALLPAMLERGAGHIVVVASVAGYRGLPTAAGYCASKAGLIALAESLKLDLDGTGIRVSVINPGFVDTPLTRRNAFPMPDIITADEAAAAIESALESKRFETAFPRRFATFMKVLRLLPDRLYFPLVRKGTRP